jgi:hypothetical protein
MAEHKITSVSAPKPWQGQHGEMYGYVLRLEGVDKPVHLNQKPETLAPTVGQTMALDLSPHKTFADALQAKRSQLGGNRGGGGKSPEERRSIQAQTATKEAVQVARIALDSGKTSEQVEQVVEATARKLFALMEELAA